MIIDVCQVNSLHIAHLHNNYYHPQHGYGIIIWLDRGWEGSGTDGTPDDAKYLPSPHTGLKMKVLDIKWIGRVGFLIE